jgi:hypothetical protein
VTFQRDFYATLESLSEVIHLHTLGAADKTYVYVMNETNWRGASVAFRVEEIIVDPFTLGKAANAYIPDEDTREFLTKFDYLALQLLDVYEAHDQPVPAAIRFIFDEDTGDSKAEIVQESVMPDETDMLGYGFTDLWFANEYKEGLMLAVKKGAKLAVEMNYHELLLTKMSKAARFYVNDVEQALIYASDTVANVSVFRHGKWVTVEDLRGEYPQTKLAYFESLQEALRASYRVLRDSFNPSAPDVRIRCGRRTFDTEAFWGVGEASEEAMHSWFAQMQNQLEKH